MKNNINDDFLADECKTLKNQLKQMELMMQLKDEEIEMIKNKSLDYTKEQINLFQQQLNTKDKELSKLQDELSIFRKELRQRTYDYAKAYDKIRTLTKKNIQLKKQALANHTNTNNNTNNTNNNTTIVQEMRKSIILISNDNDKKTKALNTLQGEYESLLLQFNELQET